MSEYVSLGLNLDVDFFLCLVELGREVTSSIRLEVLDDMDMK